MGGLRSDGLDLGDRDGEDRGCCACAVRSDTLLVSGEGVFLPIIDMINHASGSAANSHLNLRDEGVAVVVNRIVAEGDEVLLDYLPGGTMRDVLRGYGFVDDGAAAASTMARQTYRIGSGLFNLDVACQEDRAQVPASALSSRGVVDATIFPHSAPSPLPSVVRVVAVRPTLEGGVCITLRDGESSDEAAGPDGGDDLFLTNRRAASTSALTLLSAFGEGRMCAVAAMWCQSALADEDSIEEGGKGGNWSENRRVAETYRSANTSLLQRCVEDLNGLATLLELDV